jgi:hypothetical protein
MFSLIVIVSIGFIWGDFETRFSRLKNKDYKYFNILHIKSLKIKFS